MKIIIGLVVALILFFNYCIFKLSSNISKIEEKMRKEED